MTAVLLHPHYKSLLLSASGDGVLRVWNTATIGKPLLEVRDHAGPIQGLVAIGKQYATVGDDGRLVLMDIKTRYTQAAHLLCELGLMLCARDARAPGGQGARHRGGRGASVCGGGVQGIWRRRRGHHQRYWRPAPAAACLAAWPTHSVGRPYLTHRDRAALLAALTRYNHRLRRGTDGAAAGSDRVGHASDPASRLPSTQGDPRPTSVTAMLRAGGVRGATPAAARCAGGRRCGSDQCTPTVDKHRHDPAGRCHRDNSGRGPSTTSADSRNKPQSRPAPAQSGGDATSTSGGSGAGCGQRVCRAAALRCGSPASAVRPSRPDPARRTRHQHGGGGGTDGRVLGGAVARASAAHASVRVGQAVGDRARPRRSPVAADQQPPACRADHPGGRHHVLVVFHRHDDRGPAVWRRWHTGDDGRALASSDVARSGCAPCAGAGGDAAVPCEPARGAPKLSLGHAAPVPASARTFNDHTAARTVQPRATWVTFSILTLTCAPTRPRAADRAGGAGAGPRPDGGTDARAA